MGVDKAHILIEGEPIGHRIARLIASVGVPVTVLGREPIVGFEFLEDAEDFEGPLVALSRFQPSREFVFVCSCDLPGFHPGLAGLLAQEIGPKDAAIPVVGGRLQPLCALYRAVSLVGARRLVEMGERRVMRWIDSLEVQSVTLPDERWAVNVNTPADLLTPP